uniref:Uncharacterized protein n=1 Tax=Candidatus Kentrum sp. TC TaxID=2126339 RepID=A0A450YV51_9GAMM|nr:MAG: hypothetical protein BECKTC1821E_GA0114239_10486 [Candidatus Kentron sp. TC]
MAYRPVDDIQHIADSMTEAYQLNLLLSDTIGWGKMAANRISQFIYQSTYGFTTSAHNLVCLLFYANALWIAGKRRGPDRCGMH